MPSQNPQQVADRWSQGMSAATQRIQAGVNAVTTSPMEMAANAADRMLAGVQRAVQSGKWQASLRSVSLQDWKAAMLDKGINRISSGAMTAKPKFASFMQQFLPYIDQVKSTLPPRGDLEQNITRMNTMVRGLANFVRS